MRFAISTLLVCTLLSVGGTAAAGTNPYAPFMVGPQIAVVMGDSPACRAVKELQISQYAKLNEVQSKPCAPGKEVSCKALVDALTSLCAATNTKLISTCVSPWMLHAAGQDLR